MTIWIPKLETAGTPRYVAIADAIADATSSGALTAGERLPPQRELAHALRVTVGTVSRAYALAEQRGLVRGEVGRGTFIRGAERDESEQLVPPDVRKDIDLSINMPLAPWNAAALAGTLAKLAQAQSVGNLLRYMPTAGHALHRAAAARWIAQSGFAPEPELIVLTQGAQQGLAAAFDVLTQPGETVLAESLTYSGLLEMARLKQLRLAPVAIDAEGMLPEALDAQAAATDARTVVIVPTIHNPTAAVMSDERRQAIAAVARSRGLTIVEDDVYGYLPDTRPAPIAALLPEQTVYVTSASKCLAPGLRVGWLAAPAALIEAFSSLIYAESVAQPALNHEILREWIEDGTADRLVRELARETSARHALASDVLAGYSLHGHPASFHMLLELPPGFRRDELTAAALERDVRVSSVSSFAVDATDSIEAVRLSLVAADNREQLRRGLERLRELLESGPQSRRAIV